MLDIVIGLQYGSEGKGSVCQHLALVNGYTAYVRTGGPNAGHTFILGDRQIKLRQIPVGQFVAPRTAVIPAGGVIDPDVLEQEVGLFQELWKSEPDLLISGSAVVIEGTDREEEKRLVAGHGSTCTGVGSARARKVLRQATLVENHPQLRRFVNDKAINNLLMDKRASIMVEGTQGFGLSLDYPLYPKVTSGNITPRQMVADLGLYVNPEHFMRVFGVARTFPIRVAGDSGPLFGETSWEELRKRFGNHIPTEQTTVTRKTRRVGEFDRSLWLNSLEACAPTVVFLTFADYPAPELKTTTSVESDQFPESLRWVSGLYRHRLISYFGVGIGKFTRVIWR